MACSAGESPGSGSGGNVDGTTLGTEGFGGATGGSVASVGAGGGISAGGWMSVGAMSTGWNGAGAGGETSTTGASVSESSANSSASGTGGATAGAGAAAGTGWGASGTGDGGMGGTGGGSGAGSTAGGAGGTGGESGGVQALLHYYGRWNVLPDRAITVNSGSHVAATFTGTGIQAHFDTSVNLASDMPTLAWQIDQGAWQEGDLAETVVLSNELASGIHTVTLMARSMDETKSRWTPPLVSSTTFVGFTVIDGSLQMSARPTRPTIEFLGDSITEGVNVWTSHNGQTRKCWKDDARIAYPSQTAQMLGAEWRQVGFGYLGILKSGNGGVPKANDSFNWIYQDVPRDAWQPDMVVINEGTNDSGANASTFQTGYAEYMTTIRAAYPNAKIVALRPFNGSQAAPIEAAVDARVASGDQRVYYVDSTGWLGPSDYTDGVHPNQQGSDKAARALVDALQQIGLP